MAQKRAARRGRKPAAGSEDSVELGRNGEPVERRPAKKPSPEETDGSLSDQVRNGGEATDEEAAAGALAAMAAAGVGPPKAAKPSAPPRPSAAEPSEEEEGDGVTSHRQEEVAKNLPPSAKSPASQKGNEEEATKAPGPNPLPKRKRASGSTSRSQQQPKVPAPAQQRGKESALPMVSDKPKSKKIKPAPAQEGAKKQAEEELNMSQTEKCNIQTMHKNKPKSKKIKQAPAQEGAKKVHILAALTDEDVKQAEGELNMSQAEECDSQTMDRSFEEKCVMYPLVGQEVKRLAGEHPALKSSFSELDGKIALSMEKELNKVAWKELKIQMEMDTKVQAPKARVRKELVSLLALLSKKA